MNINEFKWLPRTAWLGWMISRGCKRLQMLSMNIDDNKQWIWIQVIVNEYKWIKMNDNEWL